MTTTDDPTAALTKNTAVSLVFLLSLGAVLLAAWGVYRAVADMVADLAHRTTGITWTWQLDEPLREPTRMFRDADAVAVVRGSVSSIGEITGTVRNLPVETIVLHHVGELVGALGLAGIGVCLVVIARTIGAGRPFSRTVSRAFVAMAVVVVVAYDGGAVLGIVSATTQPRIELTLPEFGGTYIGRDAIGDSVPFWPVFVAVALVALAAVFRAADRALSSAVAPATAGPVETVTSGAGPAA